MSKQVSVYSVASSKGGVGKSTITMFLAASLAKEKGKKVLIIDTDEQRTITDIYEGEQANGEKMLVTVEDLPPRKVLNYLQKYGNDFDIVFIDIPRVTAKAGDEVAAMLLSYCQAVLVPVIGSQVDLLSTIDFLNLLEQVEKDRKELDLPFSFSCFINRRNRRSENKMAEDYLRGRELAVMENSLNDVKALTQPSLQSSILETAEGQKRFYPFYTEACKQLNIK